jgi:oxygen-independent coproporphyrinogen III oxidase
MTLAIMKPGLYIHIPFCASKCRYCSFYSVTQTPLIPEFVRAVIREMEFYQSLFPSFDTIYIGGGTPSLLPVSQIDNLLQAARSRFIIDPQAEITVEANPGDLSLEYLQTLRKIGFNRLNIGIQSFDDALLKFLGRRHTAKEAIAAIDAARKAGFDNIGIDFIYGVHGQNMTIWRQTLQKALTFSPEHLSCYQLALDAQTNLYQYYQEHNLSLPSENEALELFLTTSQILTDAGYLHYEVSNFARSDSIQSRHNTKYWRHIPYLGLGPSAHSFLKNRRWWNKADVAGYLKDLAENQSPVDQYEQLSADQLALETLFLGMRTKEGIDLKRYHNRYKIDLIEEKKIILQELQNGGLVEIQNGHLRPTLSGMAMADSLALI